MIRPGPLAHALTLAGFLLCAVPAWSQGTGAGRATRIGVSLGGISTVGFVFEILDGPHSLDLAVGTWSFRDLSVSAVVKRYFGNHALQPYVGAGLWAVAAVPRQGRSGVALVVRAPLGLDAEVAERHALSAGLSVSLALAVRRGDPLDDRPPNHRLVPLPELHYRFTR